MKRQSSEKGADPEGGWRHTRVVLSPLNPDYEPIEISEQDAGEFKIIAEFVTVLRGVD